MPRRFFALEKRRRVFHNGAVLWGTLLKRRSKMATTENNLKDAFAGESQANRKYLAFAKKAEQEGFANVARLFRTAAEAETIHAHGHLAALGGVKSTAENLQAAIEGETYEYTQMYPPMLELAEKDNHQAKRMFGFASKAEAVHAKLYQSALEAVQQGKDMTETAFYLCPVCGYVEEGKAPDSCPICGTKGERFVRM
jgi:rubrerythrin